MTWRSLIRAALITGGLLLGAVPLLGQDTAFVHDTVYLPPSGYSGITFCRGNMIEMWVRDPQVGGLMPNPLSSAVEWEGILAHERTHVEQYQRYPTCAAADSAWATAPADSSLAMESEAYCAQARVFLQVDAMDPRSLLGRILVRLFQKSPNRPMRDLLTSLLHYCPELGT